MSTEIQHGRTFTGPEEIAAYESLLASRKTVGFFKKLIRLPELLWYYFHPRGSIIHGVHAATLCHRTADRLFISGPADTIHVSLDPHVWDVKQHFYGDHDVE